MNLPNVAASKAGQPRASDKRPATGQQLARTSLARAAHNVLTATLPGEPLVQRSAVDAMLAVSPESLADMPLDERRIAGAAMIRARVYSARTDGMIDFADYEAESLTENSDDGLSPQLRSLCHAALAEGYLAEGFARRANVQARIALGYAQEVGNSAYHYRADALVACSLALNGEFPRAEEVSFHGRSLETLHHWHQNTSSLPLVLADMMIGYARLDAGLLEDVLKRSRSQLHTGPVWLATEHLTTGWLHMLREQYDEALACATRLTSGSDVLSIPKLLTGFALGMQAMAQIHRGEPSRALSLLDGVPAMGDHALCFDLQRSTALLQLNEANQALQVTDKCIRMGAAHNLRTLPSILLRRAVAHLRLERKDAALRAFAEAFNLMRPVGAFTPVLGLGTNELETLLEELLKHRPGYAEAIADFRANLEARPQIRTPYITVKLTARESVVAEWLRSGLSLGEIAAKLYVSKNTIKTQTRSIYRKLGVSGREEAISRMEGMGLGGLSLNDPDPWENR